MGWGSLEAANSYHPTGDREGEIFYAGSKEIQNS